MTNKWWIRRIVLIIKMYKGRIAIRRRKEIKSYFIISMQEPTKYFSAPLLYCSIKEGKAIPVQAWTGGA
jgi:hypothetical protein